MNGDGSGTYVVDHLDISNCGEGLRAANIATSVVFSVANSRFSQSKQGYGAWFGVSQGGTQEVTVENSVFEDNVASGIAAFVDSGVLGATVRNNIITGSRNGAIHAATLTGATAASLLRVRIEHNTIGTPGVLDSGGGFLNGILVDAMGDARVIGLVNDNEVHEVADGSAIEVRRWIPGTAAAQPADVTVTNVHTVSRPSVQPLGLTGSAMR